MTAYLGIYGSSQKHTFPTSCCPSQTIIRTDGQQWPHHLFPPRTMITDPRTSADQAKMCTRIVPLPSRFSLFQVTD